jgi:hypothetical protein
MCSIFQGARLTIAATASADCSGGCYRKVPEEYCGYKVSGFDVDDIPHIYARKLPDHLLFSKRSLISKSFPLLDRGWVFQERLLARRIVHFSPVELIWECLEAVCCECSYLHSEDSLKVHQARILNKGSSDQISSN